MSLTFDKVKIWLFCSKTAYWWLRSWQLCWPELGFQHHGFRELEMPTKAQSGWHVVCWKKIAATGWFCGLTSSGSICRGRAMESVEAGWGTIPMHIVCRGPADSKTIISSFSDMQLFPPLSSLSLPQKPVLLYGDHLSLHNVYSNWNGKIDWWSISVESVCSSVSFYCSVKSCTYYDLPVKTAHFYNKQS